MERRQIIEIIRQVGLKTLPPNSSLSFPLILEDSTIISKLCARKVTTTVFMTLMNRT